MNRVKFYSNYDMTTEYNFEKSLELADKDIDKDYTINDILEFYNITKVFNKEYLKSKPENIRSKCINKSKTYMKNIAIFCKKINEENIETYLKEAAKEYVEDFFEVLDKFNCIEKISDEKFSEILDLEDSYLYATLYNKHIVEKYDNVVRKKLLRSNCAELLLDEFVVEHQENYKSGITLPKSLTSEDKNKILMKYLNII